MDEIIRAHIAACTLFKHLSGPALESLVQAASLLEVPVGQAIVKEGTTVASLYLVADGVVRVSTISLEREVELKHLGRGSYFGEVSLLSGKSATATVESAQAGTRVIALNKDAVLDLVSHDEQVRKMLEGVTLARAKDTISKVLK